MLKLSSHPSLPIFSNDIEEFGDYWSITEGTLWQTHIGRYLDAAPNKPKGVSYNKNKSLHWVLYNSFRGTDADHVVKDAAKSRHQSGHNTARNILNYYRLRDLIAETQRRLRDNIGNLKLDQ